MPPAFISTFLCQLHPTPCHPHTLSLPTFPVTSILHCNLHTSLVTSTLSPVTSSSHVTLTLSVISTLPCHLHSPPSPSHFLSLPPLPVTSIFPCHLHPLLSSPPSHVTSAIPCHLHSHTSPVTSSPPLPPLSTHFSSKVEQCPPGWRRREAGERAGPPARHQQRRSYSVKAPIAVGSKFDCTNAPIT